MQTPDFPYGLRTIFRARKENRAFANKGCWERLTHNALRNNFSAVLISRLPRWRKKICLFPVYQVLLAFSEEWENNWDELFCLLVLSVIKTIAG